MFEIKYNFSEEDIAEDVYTDEKTEHYILSPGNLLFENHHDSFIVEGSGTPVIDFAFRMLQISNSLFLKEHGRKEYEFTGSNEKIIFEKNNDKVEVIPSCCERVLEISAEDFKKGIVSFHKKVILDALRKNKSLKINALLDQYSYKTEWT